MKFINHYLYCKKKNYINLPPPPLGPSPSPAPHCFYMCFVEQILKKKKYKGTLSHKNGCLLEFF